MLVEIIILTLAYLLGSIPFGYLLVKYVFTAGEDVRQVGSGGIGATNVTRRAGLKAGLLTYLLDVAKGYAAVALMDAVTDDYRWIGAAAVAAIAGHILPVFLKFRGGKGVATGVGVYLYIAPLAVVTTLALWSLIVYLTRYVSLASIIATAAVPLWTPGDVTGNDAVNVDDLLAVITGWGPCPAPFAPCLADLTADGQVNVDDLLTVIIHWGG